MTSPDYISVFTQSEVEAAIAQIASREDARKISADIFAIPKSERAKYSWTEFGFTLLSMSSADVQKKAQRLVEGSTEYWESRWRPLREFIASGQRSELELEDIIVE